MLLQMFSESICRYRFSKRKIDSLIVIGLGSAHRNIDCDYYGNFQMLNKRFDYSGTKNHVIMKPESITARDDFLKKFGNNSNLEKQNCYLCRNEKFKIVSSIDRYGFYYPTAMCQRCGNIQQSHYYDEKTLVEFYTNYYRKIYGNVAPTVLYNLQKNSNGKKIYKIVSKIKSPKNVLEIGCGAGGILELFRDAGSQVLGLDFDDDFLDIARSNNINVKRGSTELLDENDKFDLIILSHVLEHIVEPAEFLKEVVRFLNDDGLLYIEVPSVDGVVEGGYHFDLLNYFQNAHTIHFTTKTLEMMCKSVGLRPLYQTNFIESCWTKYEIIGELSATELIENVNFSEALLNLAERRRRSYKTVIKKCRNKIRSGVVQILEGIGLKNVIKNILRK